MTEQQVTTIPQPDRPKMPEGYGIAKDEEGMLSWDYVSEVMTGALNYWISTTRPDGSPHARAVWGAWVDDTCYFEGSPETRWGRNLAANPAIAVQVERGDDAVIVEGTAAEVSGPDPSLMARLSEAMTAKYGDRYDYRPSADQWKDGGLFVVHPRVVYAWSVKEFARTPTRWRFEHS
jgi:nitroimidazol reductase NimA-like FMN-containing flavoprotein (pyridoxamine 5'-phosphate oxidase superfamily)